MKRFLEIVAIFVMIFLAIKAVFNSIKKKKICNWINIYLKGENKWKNY